MQTGILVLEIDGDEVTPLGVHRTIRDAMDAVIADESERVGVEDPALFEEQKAEFENEMREILEQEHGAPVIDVRIGSPFISMDIQFLTVEVNL